jgi:hypothetical protein
VGWRARRRHAGGIYFFRLSVGGVQESRRVTRIR